MKLHINRKKIKIIKRFVSIVLILCMTFSMGSSYMVAGATEGQTTEENPAGYDVAEENDAVDPEENPDTNPEEPTEESSEKEESSEEETKPESPVQPEITEPSQDENKVPESSNPESGELESGDANSESSNLDNNIEETPSEAEQSPEPTQSPEPIPIPVIPEEGEEDFSGLMSLDELIKMPMEAAGATMFAQRANGEEMAVDDRWSFDAYYVNQSGRYDVTQTENFNLKYQMEFHVSQDLAPGAVLIRIERKLFMDRNGNWVEPTDIGVPQGTPDAPKENRSTPFNYFYEGEDLVFFNYRKISSGTNAAWQVLYKNQKLMNIRDNTSWELIPAISVDAAAKVPTAEDPREIKARPYDEAVFMPKTPLTGRVDSSATITSVLKTPFYETGKNYTPGLYTVAQVERYITGSLPGEYLNEEGKLDMANWRFVVWDVKIRGTATQPWTLAVQDFPGIGDDKSGARVVGYKDNSDRTQYKLPITLPDSFYPNDEVLIQGEQREESWGSRFYVVTAYPAARVAAGTVVENDITARLHPMDEVDEDVRKEASQSTWSYKDYDWSYEGEKIGVTKETDKTVYTGWLDAYRQSSNNGRDYGDIPFTITGRMRGYSDTHVTKSDGDRVVGDYIPGTYYTMTTVDDFVYAYYTGGTEAERKELMGGDDYYFSSVTIRQTDYGYDIWEDERRDSDLQRVNKNDLPKEFKGGGLSSSGVKSKVRIYAMLANPSGYSVADDQGWTLIATVNMNAQGEMIPYSFDEEWIEQQPYRVKVEHDSIDFESVCQIDVKVRLKAVDEEKDQVMKGFLSEREGISRNDAKSPTMRFENLAGAMAVAYNAGGSKAAFYGDYAGEDGTVANGNYSEPGLIESTRELYSNVLGGGELLVRDSAFRDVTWLNEVAHAEKKSSSTNDVDNNRVLVDYYLTAYDGYEIYDRSCLDYLKEEDVTLISPGRSHVVFYDLLPYGVQFDASCPVTAGRVTNLSNNTYQTQPRSWDKTQVSVTVDPDRDIIPDYRGTGRTMVAFHIVFSGADSTSYTASKWIEGWGVSFRAYYEWKDMDQLNEVKLNSNIAAFMPDFGEAGRSSNMEHPALCGLKIDVDYDDGTHGDEDENRKLVEEVYANMVKPYVDKDGKTVTGNIDGYNLADTEGREIDRTYRNVLYTKNELKDDVAVSSTSKIEKLVHADSDRLGAFGQTAAVPVGESMEGLYTYDITVTAGGNTGGIVVFDRLENAAKDRGREDPFYPFAENPWSGTFRALDTSALILQGIKHTVYYSDVVAAIPEESQNPAEVLANDEWLTAEAFQKKYGEGWEANVKAIAVDMGDYVLESGHSLSFRIKMQAPKLTELPKGSSLYTYNNASFSSCPVGQETARSIEFANSVRVGLSKLETLEIVKKTAGNVPSALQNELFEFRLYEEYKYEGAPYKDYLAYTEYKLYKQNRSGEWEQQKGQVYATDGSGYLYLHADEKAVFEVADAGRITVKETDNVFWESRISEKVTELIDDRRIENREGDIHTLTVTNTYRPVLYVQKQLSAIPAGVTLTDEDRTFTFQIKVKSKGSQEFRPLASAEYWKVDSVRLDGGIPKKTEETGVLLTDENGRFTIKEGEIIALFPGVAGTEYELSEIEPEENWNWYCENMTVNDTLPAGGDSKTIINYYRWKNLLLTKEITHQTQEDYDAMGQEFTFRITEVQTDADGQVTVAPATTAEKEWVLLDESGNEIGTAEQKTAGTLDENGEFTCAFGYRTVKVKGLEAGKTYQIEELTDGIATENGKPLYIPNNDTTEVKMPVYSSQRGVTFTNDYQKRPLSVTKTVVRSADSESDEYYFFTVELKQTAADGTVTRTSPQEGTEYVVTKEGVPDVTRSIEDGQFKLADGETAVFRDFGMLGDEFIVTERNNDLQIYPLDKEPCPGTFSGDGGEADFINGAPGMLLISKEYMGVDETGKALVDEWKAGMLSDTAPEKTVKFILEVNYLWGAPYYNEICAQRMEQNDSGVIMEEMVIRPGEEFEVDPWVTIIISTGEYGLPEGASYTLKEADPNRIAKYGRMTSEGVQEHWMQISQSASSEALATEKSVVERPVATIYNEVSTIDGFYGSKRGKEMTSGSDEVPAGAVLVWRLEKYDGGSWIPAEGISYAIFNEKGEPVSDRVQTTGADGRIRLVKEDGYYPQVWFTKNQVYLNLYKAEDIERLAGLNNPLLRLVEVPEESDSEWGLLTGYRATIPDAEAEEGSSQSRGIMQSVALLSERIIRAGDDAAGLALGGSVSMNVSPDWAAAFVNSNRETTVEVEKCMNAYSDKAFTMTLKQVLSMSTQTGNAEITKEDIIASEPRDGIPYAIFNADGSQAGTGVTGPGGEFKLYAGQYVSLSIPDGTMWTVSEKLSATPTYTLVNLEPDPGNGKLTKLDTNLMLINLPAARRYTLIFDDNGGTGGPGVLSKDAEAGAAAAIQIPAIVPTKGGYEFEGWKLEGSEQIYQIGEEVGFRSGSDTKRLIAVWSDDVRLTFDFNCPQEEKLVVWKVSKGEEITIPSLERLTDPAVKRPGYRFLGWNPDPAATNMEWTRKVGDTETFNTSATFYAVWQEITYTVTYTDGVNGETVFSDQSYEGLKLGDTTPAFVGIPTREGYKFMGWTPAVNSTVDADMANDYDEIIYTATWQEVYTVIYKDGCGGAVFGDESRGGLVEGDETPAFEGSTNRNGYVFQGWAPTFKDTVDGDMANEKGEIIYTATWGSKSN